MGSAITDDVDARRAAFRDKLVAEGYLVPMGIDGLYGRSGKFEDVVSAIDARVVAEGRAAHGDRATVLRFPPVFTTANFDRTDYIASFPNLTGLIHTFTGGDKEHRTLLADRAAGLDWDPHLAPAGTALVSAACHPSYARLSGTLPEGGVLTDVYGYCFRHEPAIDPARMQAFRMHEFVVVGSPDQAVTHRDSWIPRAQAVLADLGLDVEAVPANDPFFGRAGRALVVNQLSAGLKTELVVRLYGPEHGETAIASCNYHQDHFGENFSIHTADGATAHSACVGFGMERIALGMLRAHGLDQHKWPATTKAWL